MRKCQLVFITSKDELAEHKHIFCRRKMSLCPVESNEPLNCISGILYENLPDFELNLKQNANIFTFSRSTMILFFFH